MIVAAGVSLWLTGRWLVRSVAVLVFDLLRFPLRSFSGLVIGGAVALAGLIGVGLFGGGLSLQQRSLAYVAIVFLAALLARWRWARRRPSAERGWPRFLVAWVIGGPAVWLLTYNLLTPERQRLGRDWIVLFVLAWVLVAIVVRSDRLARTLTRLWSEERQRWRDAELVRSLRLAPPAPPAEPTYSKWYSWIAAIAGPAGSLHPATLAALGVLRSGGTSEAAAAAARRTINGPRTRLASVRRRWNFLEEAVT